MYVKPLKIFTMIDGKKIDKVQALLKKAIAEIEKQENITINFSGIRYNSAYYTTQLTVKTNDVDNSKVNDAYEKVCKRLGFTQNIIGMQFQGQHGICEIIEIKTRNRKYPVIAKCSNGNQYKYTVDQVKTKIGGDKIINRNANLDKLFK